MPTTATQQRAIEVRTGPTGTVITTDQSAEGRAFALSLLDGLAAGVRPVVSDLDRARSWRRDAIFLFGETAVLAAEDAGYADPMAQGRDWRMTPEAERAAREARA